MNKTVAKLILLASISHFGLIACQKNIEVGPQTWRLTEKWTTDGIFKSPESAIYDSERNVIYVSNVNGYEENGLGYISRLSVDGSVLDEKWLVGVNAPTGMAISGEALFVADLNRLVEIDIPSASISAVYGAPVENPGLNDVSMSPAGEIFVSASSVSTIYALKDGALVEWVRDEAIEYANGLYASETELYVAAFHLKRIPYNSKSINAFGDDALLTDLESIESDAKGGFYVTLIGAKPILHVSASGVVTPIRERDVYSADIDYAPEINLLVVPSGGEKVTAFSVSKGEE